MSKFSEFSDDELLEEIVRRKNGDDEGARGDIKFCDNCEHFVVWEGNKAPPEKYSPCAFSHDVKFRVPVGYSDEWGFFRGRHFYTAWRFQVLI